jgi:hypothetical protein
MQSAKWPGFATAASAIQAAAWQPKICATNNVRLAVAAHDRRRMLLGMRDPAIVFQETGFTVHAAPNGAPDGSEWRGELIDATGEVHDGFSYTRDGFPGAVIGALRVRDIAFAPKLAARMWLHTHELE